MQLSDLVAQIAVNRVPRQPERRSPSCCPPDRLMISSPQRSALGQATLGTPPPSSYCFNLWYSSLAGAA